MRLNTARIGGRDPELTTLLRLADATRGGQGRCAIVRGRRGLGKTAVLHEVAARAAHFGDLVLMPKISADQSALRTVSELLEIPTADVDTRSTNLYPVFRGLSRKIAQLTEENAVCLLIDDLPAHDAATLRWLDFTLRRAEHLRLLIVATTDSTPATALEAPLTNLAVHPHCTVLDLAPPPSATAAEVRQRLDSLSGHARAVATAVAVLGRIEPDLVGPLAGVVPNAAAEAIHVLRREHLFWQGQSTQLRESTCAAVLGTVTQSELTRLRTRAALLLQDNGRSVDEVATQLRELDRADKPWMSRVLSGAATTASAQVPPARTALGSYQDDELGRCRLLTNRARGLVATGSLTRAEEDAQEAFAIAERNSWLSHEPGIAITLALVKAKLGRAEEAQTLLDGVGRAEVARRPTEHYEFLHASGWTNIAREDWRAAVDDLFECGQIMTESGIHDPVAVPWWADAAIVAMLRLEWPELAVEALEMGRKLALRWRTPESTALVTMIDGLVTSCTSQLTEAAERFAELPVCPWHAFAEFLLGRAHAATGNNSAARAHLRNAIGLMVSRGQSQWVADAHRLLQQAGGRMRTRPATTYDVLSASERRVLDLASSGATNREISDALYVSLRTVETHLTRVYRKLGISGRAQLRAATATDRPSL